MTLTNFVTISYLDTHLKDLQKYLQLEPGSTTIIIGAMDSNGEGCLPLCVVTLGLGGVESVTIHKTDSTTWHLLPGAPSP